MPPPPPVTTAILPASRRLRSTLIQRHSSTSLRPPQAGGGTPSRTAARGRAPTASSPARSRPVVAVKPVAHTCPAGVPFSRRADPHLVEHRGHRVAVVAWQLDVDLGDLAT